MRTKKESPLRAAGRRRPAKRIARVSRRIRSTESDATVGALADGVQVEDLGEVVLYQVKDRIGLEVRIQRGAVWLTQAQMAKLFGRERSVVSKHVNNLFTEGELDRNSNVQNMHIASSDKPVAFYSLDTIISVGYRVKSKQGTQFRIWATQTLREHLLRGYTLNEKRLRERGFSEVEHAIELLSNTLKNHALVSAQGRAVLDIVRRYTHTWRLLLEYDEGRLASSPTRPLSPSSKLTPTGARAAIEALRESLAARNESTDLFGREHSGQLDGILGAIEQTFAGEPLYPNVQSRAAHLLYFVIKDHPFSDGNKRIGTLLFLEYLRLNNLLLRADGQPQLADSTMVALALLVAESDPKHKELVVKLVLNLLEGPVTAALL